MINTDVYDYIDVLGKGINAGNLRQRAINNNIANDDTPFYKRQDVNFEGVLNNELRKGQYDSLDEKVKGMKERSNLTRLDVGTFIDASGFSYRIDKNNVDIDTETTEMASNALKSQVMIDCVSQEFGRIKSVIKS